LVVIDIGDAFVRVGFQVAIEVVGVAAAACAGVEALVTLSERRIVGNAADLVGIGGVGVGEIVNIAKITAAGVVAFALK